MVRGSICTKSQLGALEKRRIFDIFWIVRKKNVNRQKTTRFGCFEAPGVLKTAPACIFHHI